MSRAATTPPELRGFTFIKLLGSGGFSDVYLYEQELPRRQIAVKVLLMEGLTAATREAFVAEANLMAQLSAHPYIVSIHHADVAPDGRPYFVMEYCSGPSLGDRYKRQPFSVVEALRTGIRLSSAIATAHAAGILHRDIKPANVLTNDFGWPALTDFGISSAVEEAELPVHTTTRGALAGAGATTGNQSVGMSIPWSPPEMFDDNPRPDVRSDVFSLAATMYTLLAGHTPFEIPGRANGALDLMARIERGDITAMKRTDVPASLLAVLRKGMSVDRSQRYATAIDFARALQRIEMELDYAPTPIDVPNLIVPDPGFERIAEDDDATRARAVRSIPAQSTSATPATPVQQVTTTLPAPVDDRTLRRPAANDLTVVLDRDASADDVTTDVRRRRGLLAALVVGVVVLVGGGAVVIGSLLSSADGTKPGQNIAKPPGSTSPDDVVSTVVPSPTLISAMTQADGTVLIEWELTSSEPGDRFRWEQISGGSAVSAPKEETTAVLPASSTGAPVCIKVWTVRKGAQSVAPLEVCGQ